MRNALEDEDEQRCVDWLVTHRAFYAEFAPLPQHSDMVDHLYVMKDCGMMTADQRAFASPFVEIAFMFRIAADGAHSICKVVVVQPSFGHRKKSRAFHGWAFGVKCHASTTRPEATAARPYADCQTRLEWAMRSRQPIATAIDTLDQFCRDLALETTGRGGATYHCNGESNVADLAARLGQSARTLQRRLRGATGLPPKRLLAVQRFSRAVQKVPIRDAKLSAVAGELGFSDQAHLTREFQRHAGLSPGAFRRTWRGSRGQTVRFVQDGKSGSRIRLAVVAGDDDR